MLDRSAVDILLLDDEPFILKLHARMLSDLGFTSSRGFESGSLALDSLDRGAAPHLILLDLSMPGMDGIQFIKHLAQRNYAGGLVLVSGEDQRLRQTAARLVAAHGLAVVGHLAKPVTPAQLRPLLEEWERWSGGTQRHPARIYTREEIQAGIRNRQMVSHYQPKIAVETGEVVGVEALTRWQHPLDGLVSPGLFIGVAERSGLIEELTWLTMDQVLSDIADLARAGCALQVSINVSASLLTSVEFADLAAAAASRASVVPQDIIFEVTESQFIADPRAPLEVLTRLRLMRFGLSIDDFGTGYSSLSQLRDIPFGELKIDQSFVHLASSDSTARAIYDASLGLAKNLNMKTVAEGIEDQADWDLVRSTECDEAQGYLIARPMPAADLPAWKEHWRTRRKAEFGFA
jgi:EAL domain-containing protein (putative c-di-GMP-specific phosphodiesterase class I)/ActR/RegA family two-component response regulator